MEKKKPLDMSFGNERKTKLVVLHTIAFSKCIIFTSIKSTYKNLREK